MGLIYAFKQHEKARGRYSLTKIGLGDLIFGILYYEFPPMYAHMQVR